MNIKQHLAEVFKVFHGHRSPVDIGFRATIFADYAPEDAGTRLLVRQIILLEPRPRYFNVNGIKLCTDISLIFPMANNRFISSVSQS